MKEKEKVSFWQIDARFRAVLTERLFITILLLLLSVIFSIITFIKSNGMTNGYKLFMMITLMLFVNLIYILCQIYCCLADKVCKIEGIITEVDLNKSIKSKLKNSMKRPYFVMQTESGLNVKFHCGNVFKGKENDTVILYALRTSVKPISDNMLLVTNNWYLHIEKN